MCNEEYEKVFETDEREGTNNAMVQLDKSMCEQLEESMPTKSLKRGKRRDAAVRALKRRDNIINVVHKFSYHPMVGFYTGKWVQAPNKPREYVENTHISYPKHSRSQQYLKKKTAKRMRRVPLETVCGKSNIHRKYQEYWWELY